MTMMVTITGRMTRSRTKWGGRIGSGDCICCSTNMAPNTSVVAAKAIVPIDIQGNRLPPSESTISSAIVVPLSRTMPA